MIEPSSLEEDYDRTPYPAYCFPQTHPDRLATLGTLLGLNTTSVERCRVLELGCAVGGNILPMAYALPESDFTGIDISSVQIAAAQEMATKLRLRNIRLVAADIRDISPDWGEYDYIIAHGVYSWVPSDVRDAILKVCRQNLSPQGIAYVSYNTLPGWKMMTALREMMLYHVRHTTDPVEKVNQARELVDFLAESISEKTDYFGVFLGYYRGLMDWYRRSDIMLLFDELGSVNDPVYFHEFAAHANRHQLQYLAESEFPTVLPGNLRSETVERLQKVSKTVIEYEQYMDFVRNRGFRMTLLCYQEQLVQRRLQPDPAKMGQFLISSRATRAEEATYMSGKGVAHFKAPDGVELRTDHPVSQMAMMILAKEFPRAVPFDELLKRCLKHVYGGCVSAELMEADALLLATNLLRGFTASMHLVGLHKYQTPLLSTTLGVRPLASTYARLQVSQGETVVTNYLHERVQLDPISLFLLPKLDGNIDQKGLISCMGDAKMVPSAASEGASLAPVNMEAQVGPSEDELVGLIKDRLEWMLRAALLTECDLLNANR